MFKTPEQLQMRENLIYFGIGEKRFNQFSPNTGDNLINAELEFKSNHHNSLYDFTSVILKYTKSFEYEIYQLIKKLFTILIKHDPKIATILFSLNGLHRDVASLLTSKANLGSYLFLLKNEQIKHAIDGAIQNFTVKKFIINSLPFFIKSVQEMRNENVHGKPATLTDAKELRAEMIGVGKMSMLVEIVKNKEKMDKK